MTYLSNLFRLFGLVGLSLWLLGGWEPKLLQAQPAAGNSVVFAPLIYGRTLARIGVRPQSNSGEFYNTTTGARFVPRGYNYIRLALQHDPFDPNPNSLTLYHSTFDPNTYNHAAAQVALAQFQNDGYNTVRVFINDWQVGNSNGGGLDPVYLDNVADFLRLAQTHNQYVLVTLLLLPRRGGYYPAIEYPLIKWENVFYLTPDFTAAKGRYLQDFIRALQARQAPLNTILAYSLENEVYFAENQLPLSLSSGVISTTTGLYDISSPAQRQQMMDSNLNYWINAVRTQVKALDPQALVTVGFFSPAAVNHLWAYSANGASQNSGQVAQALDDNPATAWSATTPNHWLEVQHLSTPPVTEIRLLTYQTLAATATYTIYAGLTPTPTTVITSFTRTTNDAQWLTVWPTSPLTTARYVRVETTGSSATSGWREIKFFEDPRVTRTLWAIADSTVGGSTADFIDLHLYPYDFAGQPYSLTADIASFEIPLTHTKPLLLGEFGAFKAQYTNTTTAAYAMRDVQVTTCVNYSFVGWLFWTWDTAEQPELWNAQDNSGAINGVLAPIVRPNACTP